MRDRNLSESTPSILRDIGIGIMLKLSANESKRDYIWQYALSGDT